jgi:hypothetical protein
LKETGDIFDLGMDACNKSDHDNFKQFRFISGVRCKPIVFGDPYHWVNLVVMHASKGFAGDTENSDHEQNPPQTMLDEFAFIAF